MNETKPTLDMTTQSVKYPECERLADAVQSGKAEQVQDLLDWLTEQDWHIGEYHRPESEWSESEWSESEWSESEWSESEWSESQLVPLSMGPEAIMYRYFGIDPQKIDAERRQILAEVWTHRGKTHILRLDDIEVRRVVDTGDHPSGDYHEDSHAEYRGSNPGTVWLTADGTQQDDPTETTVAEVSVWVHHTSPDDFTVEADEVTWLVDDREALARLLDTADREAIGASR